MSYLQYDDYALHHFEIRPQVIDTPDEVTEHNVVFDAIQDEVIQGIRDAKFIILVAVAWFSNEAIRKKEAKIKYKNNSLTGILKYKYDFKIERELVRSCVHSEMGSRGYNRMHDKFFIIDMDYVMHGSYNWTLIANYNEETLATALDYDLVAKFAKEFIELYNGVNF